MSRCEGAKRCPTTWTSNTEPHPSGGADARSGIKETTGAGTVKGGACGRHCRVGGEHGKHLQVGGWRVQTPGTWGRQGHRPFVWGGSGEGSAFVWASVRSSIQCVPTPCWALRYFTCTSMTALSVDHALCPEPWAGMFQRILNITTATKRH